jgi:hypothetical protein
VAAERIRIEDAEQAANGAEHTPEAAKDDAAPIPRPGRPTR